LTGAQLLGDQLRSVGVDRVGDLVHRPPFISMRMTSTARPTAVGGSWIVIAPGSPWDELFLRLVGGVSLRR
jgi:hypothetical protein